MHMPPPVHGAAMMGQYIHDSKLINEEFDCIYINPSASKNVTDVGKISFRKIGFLFSNLFTITKTVRREKPDLCYLTPTSDGWGIYRDALTIGILKLLRKKIILHFHNKGVATFSKRPFTHFAYRILFSNTKIILLSKELYNDVKEFVKTENIYFCPNGIPETLQTKVIRNQTHTPYTFFFLSNMIESKGVYILVEACAILKQRGLPFKCNFVGKWSDVTEEGFTQKVAQLGVTNEVKAFGAKYGDEKKEFFETADALVFPTYYHGETFGLVLLEAMEYGLPCISTMEGGIPSIIEEGRTGFLVPPRNPEQLADKMIWLIEHPDEGIKMGENGRQKFLSQYTLSVFENNLSNILKRSL